MSQMEMRSLERAERELMGVRERKQTFLVLLGCSILQLPIWGAFPFAKPTEESRSKHRRFYMIETQTIDN